MVFIPEIAFSYLIAAGGSVFHKQKLMLPCLWLTYQELFWNQHDKSYKNFLKENEKCELFLLCDFKLNKNIKPVYLVSNPLNLSREKTI